MERNKQERKMQDKLLLKVSVIRGNAKTGKRGELIKKK